MSRAIRIANASGFFGDRGSALREVVEGGPVDVVTGDYLSEVTMTVLAKLRAKDPGGGYVPTFLQHLQPVLGVVVERGIKVVVNAGGLNPAALVTQVQALAARSGVAVKVAWLEGDDLAPRIDQLRARGERFASLESGEPLSTEPGHVVTAHAYLGAWGIVRALAAGADIVVCPRVTDASLVVGPAAWWHGWRRDDWDALAGAVAAGHVIECGAQATGGNYSSFRRIPDLRRPGFPIAEIAADGSSVVTKHPGTGGSVSVGTVTAQLVYEIGDARYLNPDVVTHLDTIELAQEGVDRVSLRGTKGSPPPPTTKVAVTMRGDYRNELTLALVGLDIDAKIELFERTTRALFAHRPITLRFQRIGAVKVDASTQDEATVLLRVVATSADEGAVSRAFSGALVEQGLASYPGLFLFGLPGGANEANEYWPTTVAQSALEVWVTLPDGTREPVASALITEPIVSAPRATVDDAREATTVVRAPTRRVALGHIVDARSGDKGSRANVGLWVRSDDAYAWLQRELTVARLRELLPEAKELCIARYTLPKLRALNFVIEDLLAGGAAASVRFDRQAKAVGEFLRSRLVDVPAALIEADAATRSAP